MNPSGVLNIDESFSSIFNAIAINEGARASRRAKPTRGSTFMLNPNQLRGEHAEMKRQAEIDKMIMPNIHCMTRVNGTAL